MSEEYPKTLQEAISFVENNIKFEFAVDSRILSEELVKTLLELPRANGLGDYMRPRDCGLPILSVGYSSLQGNVKIRFYNSYSVREQLKRLGFSWDPVGRCWYKIFEIPGKAQRIKELVAEKCEALFGVKPVEVIIKNMERFKIDPYRRIHWFLIRFPYLGKDKFREIAKQLNYGHGYFSATEAQLGLEGEIDKLYKK